MADVDDFIAALTVASETAGFVCDPGKTHLQLVFLDRPEASDAPAPLQIVQGISFAAIKALSAGDQVALISDLVASAQDAAQASLKRNAQTEKRRR